MQRRQFLIGSGLAAIATVPLSSRRSDAQSPLKEIRIGYQKTGVLVIARQRGTLENHFAKDGIGVRWVEFTSGPPMMEAISVGSVDFGAVGDSPPIFAQAANANIVYAAASPITNGQGILVPHASQIRNVTELKGKRVGFTKGTSAHNVVVQALERFGLTYADITPVYLTPPDAGAAFANGGIDAWAVWDPYFAIGEAKQNARILINAKDVAKTNSFFIANRDFARKHGATLRATITGLGEAASWAEANRADVAKTLHSVTNIPLDVQTIAANRAIFRINSVTEDILETQQGVADRFHRLGLIPRQIVVRDAVWQPTQT